MLRCEECGAVATDAAVGWRAYRVFDPEEDDAPEVVIYCPVCAAHEFGLGSWPGRSAEPESV